MQILIYDLKPKSRHIKLAGNPSASVTSIPQPDSLSGDSPSKQTVVYTVICTQTEKWVEHDLFD